MPLAAPSVLLLVVAFVLVVESALVHYDFTVRKHMAIQQNESNRTVALVNEQFPGPTIDVQEVRGAELHSNQTNHKQQDDTIEVSVRNDLDEALTIHWHGIHQRGTPFYDGVSEITQCRIPQAGAMTYRFQASPPGTHFWHSHMPGQAADGVSGAIVVRKASDPYGPPYCDGEFVVLMSDWFNATGKQMIQNVIDRNVDANMWSDAPFEAALMNGKGGAIKALVLGGGNTVDVTNYELFSVTNGKKYRFRLINSGSSFAFRFSIDLHKFRVIAVDGNLVEPRNGGEGGAEVDSVVLHVGERVDIVLTANQDISSYWVRATTLEETTGQGEFDRHDVKGLLQYIVQEREEGQTKRDLAETRTKKDLKDFNLMDVKVSPSSFVAAQRIPHSPVTTRFTLSMSGQSASPYHYGLNNIYFQKPKDLPGPLLFQNISALQQAGVIQSHTQILKVGRQEVVELVIDNPTMMWHPFHLHGHYFAVMGLGDSDTDPPELTPLGTQEVNDTEPVYKDTLNIPPLGWTHIRFYTDNPGTWLFHCHIEFHLETGMALLFEEDSANFPAAPAVGLTRCNSNGTVDTNTDDHDDESNTDVCIVCYGLVGLLVLTTAFVTVFYISLRVYFARVDRQATFIGGI